jgi:putative lipoic acid-binding regulatory protein
MLPAVDSPKLLTFPCEYPIKVLARAGANVRAEIDPVVARHAGAAALAGASERSSAQAHFVSITYLLMAQSEAQIAALFNDLKQCQSVVLVL